MFSAIFLVSTISLAILSSSAWASASLTILSISSSDNPLDALITIDCSLPVALSLADTFRIPFASILNATSICGTPLGAGGISDKSKRPRDLLPEAISLSPCNTCIVTAVWLSSAVENTCWALVGMVVFFSINLVITPPNVSIPSDKGVTSSNSTSFTSPPSTPAWIAAPEATASSGFTSFLGSLPNIFDTVSCTLGIRVWPPTRITSVISDLSRPASFNATWQGSIVLSINFSTSDSSFARESLMFICLGPEESAVM